MKLRILVCFSIMTLAVGELPAAESDPGFVAHEWGTFTSVQGSDGVQMIWNPRVAPDLPDFVYDQDSPRGGPRLRGLGVSGKLSFPYRQRMETPVIYFYSDRTRTVDVSVKFPHGVATEWFPFQSAPIALFAPAGNNLAVHWAKIQLLAESEAKGVSLSEEKPGSNYYAARQADSAILRTAGPKGAPEVEKFLFYRGAGSDNAPLTVKSDSANPGRLTLSNSGSEELRNLFVFEVRENGGGWLKVDRLAPGESRDVTLPSGANAAPLTDLASSLREALVREGLYPREAAAMLKTWDSSWFSERGTRVLYTLPRPWTDQVLPLQITPAPREMTRVMVARGEIITGETEQALQKLGERYAAAPEFDRAKIVSETRALGLGRFTETAMQRVSALRTPDPKIDRFFWELAIVANAQPAPKPSPAATN